MRVGFIGLGKMGSAMAKNLAAAGHQLVVYNRTRQKTEPLAQAGARIAADPAEAAKGADAVFTMLANDHAVSETVAAFSSSLGDTTIHIGSSTVSVELAKRLAKEGGHRYVSAPVFGRPDAAEKKKLVLAAAGDSAVLERVRPLLDAVGRQTFIVGHEPWQANAIKICGNFMIASMLETFSEAITTLRKAGADPDQFLNVILEVFGSPVYSNYGRQIGARQFDTPGGGFALELGLKDVGLATHLAQSVKAPMPLASLLQDHFVSAMAHDQAHLDWTSIALVLERAAAL